MMKKYMICSFSLIIALTGAYIFSYHKLSESKETVPSPGEAVGVLAGEETVKADALLIIETYNAVSDAFKTQELTMPAAYLGLTRNGIMEKLRGYMDELPVSELEDGLIAFELIYFSPEQLTLRKTYAPREDFKKYYIKLSKGCITVYYSDKKTVYEYTDMDFNALPPEIAAKVLSGMEIKDEKALYDFLENYSS